MRKENRFRMIQRYTISRDCSVKISSSNGAQLDKIFANKVCFYYLICFV